MKKLFFSNQIVPTYDFRAQLECKLDPKTSNWSFILSNMSGNKKDDLVGSITTRIDLNQLIPGTFAQIHSKYLVDILLNKERSQYWDLFVNGKMKRSVDIINPISKKLSNVKLGLELIATKSPNKWIFSVEMTDITTINKVINTTGLLTHDLRSILKSAKNIVNDMEKIDSNSNQQIRILSELLDEGLAMCSQARTAFLPENIVKTSQIYLVKIYKELWLIVKKLQLIYPNINFTLKHSCTGFINSGMSQALKHLILNMGTNSFNAGATQINIRTFSDPNDLTVCKIYIEDNGCGMDLEKTKNFFSRKLPQENKIHDTCSNRGEGFVLSYNQIKELGGSVQIETSDLNIGTTFLVNIPIIPANTQQDNFILNLSQVEQLNKIDPKTKLILFVDDVLLNIKLLCINLIKYLNPEYTYTNFPVISSSQWETQGIHVITFDSYTFVFTAHGLYGLELATLFSFDLIITDIQMPHLNGIDMIKMLIESKITSKILVNSALSKEELESSQDLMELTKTSQVAFLEKGSKINFSQIFKLFD